MNTNLSVDPVDVIFDPTGNPVFQNEAWDGWPILQSVSWSLAEFRHNKIVQSPHENYFNVCRQHKEK